MNEKNYEWFIQPLDSHANEVLSRQFCEESSLQTSIVCADGKRRTMWQCNSDTARYVWRSRGDLHLNIKIFGRIGRGKNRSAGKPKDLTFLFSSRPRARKTETRKVTI